MEARIEEFDEETPTARTRRARPVARRVRSSSPSCSSRDGVPVVALVPGDRRADVRKVSRTRRRPEGAVRDVRGGRGGDRLRAGRGRPFPLPKVQRIVARADAARAPARLGRRGLDASPGVAGPARAGAARRARSRWTSSRRPRTMHRRPTREEARSHAGDREDLDERRARRLGRREGPRRRPRAPLRHRASSRGSAATTPRRARPCSG